MPERIARLPKELMLRANAAAVLTGVRCDLAFCAPDARIEVQHLPAVINSDTAEHANDEVH